MYEVGVTAYFEAAHRLRGDFGPAANLHGHTYKVVVAARGPSLRQDGTLCDLGRLQSRVAELAASLHYRNLDEVDELAGVNTTAEALARYFFDRLAEHLAGELATSLEVRVWESPVAYAGYEGALTGGRDSSSE